MLFISVRNCGMYQPFGQDANSSSSSKSNDQILAACLLVHILLNPCLKNHAAFLRLEPHGFCDAPRKNFATDAKGGLFMSGFPFNVGTGESLSGHFRAPVHAGTFRLCGMLPKQSEPHSLFNVTPELG